MSGCAIISKCCYFFSVLVNVMSLIRCSTSSCLIVRSSWVIVEAHSSIGVIWFSLLQVCVLYYIHMYMGQIFYGCTIGSQESKITKFGIGLKQFNILKVHDLTYLWHPIILTSSQGFSFYARSKITLSKPVTSGMEINYTPVELKFLDIK